MSKIHTTVGVKVDADPLTLSSLLGGLVEIINAHLPKQTRLSNPHADQGRYVYVVLTDFDLGDAVNARTVAYVQGLLAGALISNGIEVL